jgi:hypothetical protein
MEGEIEQGENFLGRARGAAAEAAPTKMDRRRSASGELCRVMGEESGYN